MAADPADELSRNFTTHASRVLPPIAKTLVAQVGAEDDDALIHAIRDALARAFMAGTHAGQIETVAQMVERGVNVQNHIVGGPDPDSAEDK